MRKSYSLLDYRPGHSLQSVLPDVQTTKQPNLRLNQQQQQKNQISEVMKPRSNGANTSSQSAVAMIAIPQRK